MYVLFNKIKYNNSQNKILIKPTKRKISTPQMAGITLIRNLLALISIRVPLETSLPTNGKLKFDSNNNDSKSNYSNSSGNNNDNNEYEYSYNNDNNDDDKSNSNNNNKKCFG